MQNTNNYANMARIARNRALRNTTTVVGIKPTPAPNGQGYYLHTYTSARLGRCTVVARLLCAQGHVVGYRVIHQGQPMVVPPGNLAAHGTLYVPKNVAITAGYTG